MKMMKTRLWMVAIGCLFVQGLAAASTDGSSDKVVIYEVNRSVDDFPDTEDFSTPESAYAAINRVMAKRGSAADWARVSGKEAKDFQTLDQGNIWEKAYIREVDMYKGEVAIVIAQVREKSGGVKYDQRFVVLKDGHWFNRGQDPLVDSLGEARDNFGRKKERLLPSWESEQYKIVREYAAEHPEEFRAAATRLFEAIRTADYDRITNAGEMMRHLGASNIHYMTATGYDAWTAWVCRTFKANPIVDVWLSEPVLETDGLPSFRYILTLQDGATLKGELPLNHDPVWCGVKGLDWHLESAKTKTFRPVALLLEEGIYAEETVGDLARAIEIYTEIVADDQANRKYVAESHFRLGRCCAAEGKTDEALRILENAIKQYPNRRAWVEEAESIISGLRPAPLFPELDGCRLKYVIPVAISEKSSRFGSHAFHKFDQIKMDISVSAALAGKIDSFKMAAFLTDKSGKQLKVLDQIIPGGTTPVFDAALDFVAPGKYQCQVIGFRDSVQIAIAEGDIEIKPAMDSQLGLNEIQPDGTIRFISAQQCPQVWRTLNTRGFINSDFVHIEKMFDKDGNDVEFTEKHEGNIYRYRATLNKPVYEGGTLFLGSKGWMERLVRKVENDTFQYRMNHTPGGNAPTQRVEIFRLPKGAQLLSTTPADLPHRVLEDGRVEILIDTVIPVGGSLLTEFHYRLAAGSD